MVGNKTLLLKKLIKHFAQRRSLLFFSSNEKSIIYPLLLSITLSLFAQIDPKKIDIVRDAYGVPHIFAKTDAEVAYGLAWAHAEDDFITIQQSYLAGNNLLSNHLGKKGIPADFLAHSSVQKNW